MTFTTTLSYTTGIIIPGFGNAVLWPLQKGRLSSADTILPHQEFALTLEATIACDDLESFPPQIPYQQNHHNKPTTITITTNTATKNTFKYSNPTSIGIDTLMAAVTATTTSPPPPLQILPIKTTQLHHHQHHKSLVYNKQGKQALHSNSP